MLTFSLQSGSNGNAIYVEADGVRLLFDAGISGVQARTRMALHGRDIRAVDALILSHRHSDHTRCAGVYQRAFHLPIYASPATHHAMRPYAGALNRVQHFLPGQTLAFNGVKVRTVPTPHDAAESVAFIIEAEGRRLGIFTDLGHPFPGLGDLLSTLDAMYLESNYDPQMLADGPYPEDLQDRIRGDGGHLSNLDAAALLKRHVRDPRWVALAHLSEHNNTPELALHTHRQALGKCYPLLIASRYRVSDVMEV